MATNKLNDSSLILDAIKKGVEFEVRDSFEVYKKQMIESLDKRKDEICAGIVLNVMKYVQMQTLNENLVITIKKIED